PSGRGGGGGGGRRRGVRAGREGVRRRRRVGWGWGRGRSMVSIVNAGCWVMRSTAYVTTIDATEGRANWRSHSVRCGIRSPNTTRLAGFEIGSTKLAALATKAQTHR